MNAEKSQAKIKQVQELLASLQIQVVAKQVITKEGFVEMAIFYNDLEKYPTEPQEPEVVEPALS